MVFHINHITKIKVNQSIILPSWFAYSINKLWLDGFFAKNSKKWVGQAGYNQDMLKEQTYIPLPPLPEQKRIVQKLSSMLEKLKQAKELICEAKETFENRRAAILDLAFTGKLTTKWREDNLNANVDISKSIAINMMPFEIPSQWRWVLLKNVSEKSQYGTSSKSDREGKVPVIRMGNIQDGRIDWNNLVYSSDDSEIEKYALKQNDILFNRTNSPALVGKTAIYKSEMPAIFAGYLIRVRPLDILNPDYLNYFLNSPYAKMKCQEVKTDAVNQSNINSQKLGNFEIPIAPIEEQRIIIGILDCVLGEENESYHIIDLEKEIELIEKSILSKAFRGELDTNDPDDEPAQDLLKRILQERQKAQLKPAPPKPQEIKDTVIKAAPISIKLSISGDISVSSDHAQMLIKTINEKIRKKTFTIDELKDHITLSYEDLNPNQA